MAHDQNLNLRRIFELVLEAPAPDRAGILDRECGADPSLRARIEAMVAAAESDEFLTEPTANVLPLAPTVKSGAANAAPLTEMAGTRIGPYKLLQLIGEGGFGSVFMAEQEKPVVRKVALKIIKLGMDTRAVIARFEAERQALAMMDHPHIARVLDAGATDTGRPYFVMELCKGDPITLYCDKHNLGIRERLSLVAQVCQAVQHAHTKGVIHRDIKPSNILVSSQDGHPSARVIDFGIAKATASKLTEKTLFTEHRQLIGTPEYMSPEQAEGSMDIDTRTDVYSLGVLLYELLTGSTPFDSTRLRSAAFAEIQRIIREVDPPNPSTRLSQSTDTIASVAARRHTEPKRLGAIIRGELDWIVMMAMEKDRARRYESANNLAADIQRYLAGEAVFAAPPSATYRLRKVVLRHKAAVTAVVAIAGALLLGVIGTTVGLVRATAESRRAFQQETKATQAAQDEARAKRTAETISDFVTAALQSADAVTDGGQDVTVLQAMRTAIDDLDSGRFTDDPKTEAQLRETIAAILRNNGDAPAAAKLVKRALEINQELHKGDHADIARTMNQLAKALVGMGEHAEAERLSLLSLDMFRRLRSGDDSDVAALLNNIGQIREETGRPADAEPLLVEAVSMLERLHPGDHTDVAKATDNLAKVRDDQGRYPEAETLYLKALEMRRRLYKRDHPDLAIGLGNLAVVLVNQQRVEEALPLARESLEISRRLYKGDHPIVAERLANFAGTLTIAGRATEAEPFIAEALDMNRRLHKGDHATVAHSLFTLAGARLELGRAAEAEPISVESVAMHKRIYRGDHIGIAMSLVQLARIHQALARIPEALPEFDQAVAMLRRLMPDSPLLARTLWQSGSARLAGDDAAGALPLLKEAVSTGEKLLPPGHAQLEKYRQSLAQCEQQKSDGVKPENDR